MVTMMHRRALLLCLALSSYAAVPHAALKIFTLLNQQTTTRPRLLEAPPSNILQLPLVPPLPSRSPVRESSAIVRDEPRQPSRPFQKLMNPLNPMPIYRYSRKPPRVQTFPTPRYTIAVHQLRGLDTRVAPPVDPFSIDGADAFYMDDQLTDKGGFPSGPGTLIPSALADHVAMHEPFHLEKPPSIPIKPAPIRSRAKYMEIDLKEGLGFEKDTPPAMPSSPN